METTGPVGAVRAQIERPVSILGVALSAAEWESIRRSPVLRDARASVACNCREVCSKLADRSTDIVISTSVLPDGTWRDVVISCRRLPASPPVIVASRLADERLWAEVLNLGGYDLIAMPPDTAELTRIVLTALGSTHSG